MDTYKYDVKNLILLSMGIVLREDITETERKLEERLESKIAKKLPRAQMRVFPLLFQCRTYEGVQEILRQRGIEITISAVRRSANRAMESIVKLANKDTLIQEWGRQWRESQKTQKNLNLQSSQWKDPRSLKRS